IKNGILNQINASNKSFIFNNIVYSAQDIVNGISVTLPQNVTMSDEENGTMHNVTLQYNGVDLSNTANSKDFIVEPFKETNSQNIINNNTNGIISKLELLIKDPIALNNYNLNVEQSLMSENHQTLLNAINQIIEDEIGKEILVNNIIFTTSEIMQNLIVKTPSTDSVTNYVAGRLIDVKLEFNNVLLNNSSGSTNYTVINFKIPTAAQIQAQDKIVATKVPNVVSNPITFYDESCPYTAQEVVQNHSIALHVIQDILMTPGESTIGTQTDNNMVPINVNNILYYGSDMAFGAKIIRANVTPSENEQGVANNVLELWFPVSQTNPNDPTNIIYTKKGKEYWDMAGFKKAVSNTTNIKTPNTNLKTNWNIVSLLTTYMKNDLDQYFKYYGNNFKK
ncbi:MAG: hypothetical protein IIT97_02085, partial [Mycoplasmataceae bacterium]|nr:hypothetical protein [Mycoplasmataceae bacterium]